DRLADLVGRDFDLSWQARQQVTTAEREALRIPFTGIGRGDRDLDVLRGSLAQQQVVLAPAERDDVLVHLVAADADALAHDDAAQADDRHFRRAATDVDDEAAGGLPDREARADRCGHRFVDQPGPARAGIERR